MLTSNVPKTWETFFESEKKMLENIETRISEDSFFPERENIFRCFIPLEKIKILIIGMDPYFNKGEAMGLCFSVNRGVKIPPSLRNIYKEIKNGGEKCDDLTGDISHWADQGCFMLNAALTVREGKAGTHLSIWKPFTKNVIKHILKNTKNIGVLAMGNPAIELMADCFAEISDNNEHVQFLTSHPSPLGANKASKYARAFTGSCVFKEINGFLEKTGRDTIRW